MGELKEEDCHPKMPKNLRILTLHGPLLNYAPLIDEMKVEKVVELIVEPDWELLFGYAMQPSKNQSQNASPEVGVDTHHETLSEKMFDSKMTETKMMKKLLPLYENLG